MSCVPTALILHKPVSHMNGLLRSQTILSRNIVQGSSSRFTRINRAISRAFQNAAPTPRSPPLVFAFDIDGVLIRGSRVLPAAKRALAMLEGDNPMRVKIPYILITNGGGSSEEDRCLRLTKQLGFDIKPTQFIQAHTILKSIVEEYAETPVLVLGGKYDMVRRVAKGYGFQKAYTTLDVHAWNPSVWPFHELSDAERATTQHVDFATTPISAIFVFHDPRNWSLDVQVICDVIQSGGVIGGPYIPVSEQLKERKIDLVFCNPDLVWRGEFERPRLGQGAFREAFQAVYKALTGTTYPYVQHGKPTESTYKFAQKVLSDRLQELLGHRPQNIPQVYMVGDNPESDIAGANAAKWSSILVRTGVYDPSFGPSPHTPTYEAEDVEEAVKWAINREMSKS
ncbi:hypothetical protein JAAARDRAFT_30147 [Jaapia argillacea MUCL 33604]|uniref:Uncharacterized protein n=1 Tax=Jaapia argillacea MUCL 33604 TaxID=933084 RepID=A0A067QI24_9AGAM|nr:hypothetical protein JAAARDRAFT_30147 [Jaapia argillacea MUCL 33604]